MPIQPASAAASQYWNPAVRFSFFEIVTWLLTTLHTALQRERKLARTGYLTGAVNRRSFYETVQMEMHRNRRHERPFSLAYLDVDHFKLVNDQWGHSTADLLLRTIVDTLTKQVRQSDVVARTPATVDELVQLVDITMYKVKETGKNGFSSEVLRTDVILERVPALPLA